MRLKIQLFLLAMLAAAFIVAPAPLAAQSKIGVVDFQTALLDTADMQAEAAKLEAEFKPRQDALAALSGELQQIQAKLQSASPEEAARLQAEGAAKQREAQRLTEDLQSEVEYRREGILQKGAQRMREVLDKVRQENSYDLIVDASGAYAFNPALDITAEATAAYNAAHPVN